MAQSPSQAEQLPPGTVLAQRYRIVQLIGSGGYASVYRALDIQQGVERAIKEVADSDGGVRRQFELEAGLLIHANHPNIPCGYQLFEERGRLYLVMEFVLGRDLEDLLNESLVQRHRALDEAQVLEWAVAVCEALEVMHEREVPIIHRDIKPANIKIRPDDRPVLIDFGLAKLQTGGPTRTAAQGVSPGFAPPEQYMAKGGTDARTDIYGLGATLYACLTGKDPAEAPARLLAQAQAGTAGHELTPPRRMPGGSGITPATDQLIVRALELSPGRRFQSAREMSAALQAALRHLTGAPCPRCGAANPVDAPRCQYCGASLLPATLGAAISQITGKRGAAAAPARAPGSPVPLPRASSKQPAVPPASSGAHQLPFPPGGTGKQPAALAGGATGKQPAAAAGPAVMGAVALAPAPISAPAEAQPARREPSPRPVRQSAAALDAQRSWLNLGGPALNRVGKSALALSAVETCWGALLLALAGVEVATRGTTQKPWLTMGLIWLAIVVVVSAVGAQMLGRPVYRRGQMKPWRRGLQGFGLTLYSVAVHAVAIWGVLVFAAGAPDAALAIVALALFGVNVLLAGVLSLVNTLG